MRQKIELLFAIAFLCGLLWVSQNLSEHTTSMRVQEEKMVIVVDPGHGGNDPGKVGVNGALEKEINLLIAGSVKAALEKKDIEVVMTRENDEMLSSSYAKNKKLEDMKQRVDLINKKMPVLVVSIHQNSFQDAGVSGAQVFYCEGSEEGKRAAEIMQVSLQKVDETNRRQAKANDSYYLLKHTEVPVIIVECGFLSNPTEADLLVTKEYQKKIANAVCEGIYGYLGIK